MVDTRQRYDVDLVRERTDLLALIGQHVALKKRGGRYVGLCPFHQEKTPSFSVDPQKGFWHCFGCGKGGDAFNFIMQMEGLAFGEALERLAERAGVRPSLAAEPAHRKEERDFLFEVNAAAAVAFCAALRGRAGAQARAYLAGRGISPEHAERFGLGYAPKGWDALVSHLTKRGFLADVMVKAGLALVRSSGNGHIDRFRHRLMVPIHDRQGRVVAFGGRALSPEDQPKYLNTAETPIFHKGRTLYALHLAAEQIGKRGRAIITEGYFDAIACHLAGFPETVATLGTALSEDHAQILRRLADRVYLVFDADSAGVNAALRSQAVFRQLGTDVRIVRLPDGHDPDTLLREGGAEAFEQCLQAALSPVDFELERMVRQHPGRDPESRVRLFRAAAKILHPLPGLERAEYAARLIDRWQGGAGGDTAALQQAMLSEVAALDRSARRRDGGTTGPREAAPATPPPAAESDVPLEREVMTLMVQQADFAARVLAAVPAEAFTHPTYRQVFLALRAQQEQGGAPDARHVVTEADAVASAIAALAIREPLQLHDLEPGVISWISRHGTEQAAQPDDLLAVLKERYEKRLAQPREIALDDHEAAHALMERIRAQSRSAKRRIFGQES